MTTATAPSQTVERFAQMSPQDYGREVDNLLTVVGEIADLTKQQVQNQTIQPDVALSILACTSGQLFGYQAFHGQPTQADVIAWLGNSRQQQQQRS